MIFNMEIKYYFTYILAKSLVSPLSLINLLTIRSHHKITLRTVSRRHMPPHICLCAFFFFLLNFSFGFSYSIKEIKTRRSFFPPLRIIQVMVQSVGQGRGRWSRSTLWSEGKKKLVMIQHSLENYLYQRSYPTEETS